MKDDLRSIRSMKGSYADNFNYYLRLNPRRIFCTEKDSRLKFYVVRRYCKQPKQIKDFLSKLPKKSHSRFLTYLCKNFDLHRNYLTSLYDTNSTWDIAKLLATSQTTVSRLYGPNNLNISNRSMRCSKIHLKMKPDIEILLGYKTSTEFYMKPYWIDEYCEELDLCIEIDGKWCHDKIRDKIKDGYIRSKGLDVIRIPAYSSYSEMSDIINSWVARRVIS